MASVLPSAPAPSSRPPASIGPRHIAAADVHESLNEHLLVDGYPLVVDLDKSHGSYLYDAKSGHEYLDFFTFFSSNPIGFNHPRMHSADFSQRLLRAARTRVSNSDVYTSLMAEFVTTLERTAGLPELPYYFFVDGGALAVENAMKAAFDWKRRKNIAAGRSALGEKILHFEHAFHGRSGYTLSVTNTDPVKTDYFPQFIWPRVPSPAISFPFRAHQDEVLAREAACLTAIEDEFDRGRNEIAGILIEPIQSEGGDRHFRSEFLAELRKLADTREALLIFDEVQTGLGSTGRWWASQYHGVTPDLLCFAKKLQVGGLFASRRLDDVEDHVFAKSGRINSTWGGSLTDMVRATQILRIIEDEALLNTARQRGHELHVGLQALELRWPDHLSNARGAGLICAIDLRTPALRDAVIAAAMAEHMLVLACGTTSLRFRPALNVSCVAIAEGLGRLEAALLRTLGRPEPKITNARGGTPAGPRRASDGNVRNLRGRRSRR